MADSRTPTPRRAAAESGEVIYDARTACSSCGSLQRYTSSGQCVPCTKTRANNRLGAIRETLSAAKTQGGRR